MIEIKYPEETYFESYHAALSVVAKEKVYLEMIEAPALEIVSNFQRELVSKNGAGYYAVHSSTVVGWCDIFQENGPRLCHRGRLGMGIIPGFRGQGVGSKLLSCVIAHAKKIDIEKIELTVYSTNEAGIALYKKFNFKQEGLIKNYRKLDGVYFDAVKMALFL